MNSGTLIFLFGAAGIVAMFLWAIFRDRVQYRVPKPFPQDWKMLLNQHVHFYQNLNHDDKSIFENKVRNFLSQVRITGIRLEVSDLDRLLVASSAVIPLFNLPKWTYTHLHEVLLYPSHFDSDFSTEDPKEVITGMVGSDRNMDGIMILCRESLIHGFSNTTDKRNVGVHEFVHILDKQDGQIDGVSLALNDPAHLEPWLSLVRQKIIAIKEGTSDIDEYAATGEEEFLAVTSEYFFEKPKQLKRKHPELYGFLQKVYQQDMITRLKEAFKRKKRVGRNDLCPCGSGEKFKKCCLQKD